MSEDTILELDSLSKSFAGWSARGLGASHPAKRAFIKDVDLKVPRGKITALVGGNGSGKTTVFNLISRLMDADRGRALFWGGGSPIDLMTLSPYEVPRVGIGRLFQDKHLLSSCSVIENMIIADGSSFGEAALACVWKRDQVLKVDRVRSERAEEILCRIVGDAEPFWRQKDLQANQLSYGQQRLLAFARLFMGKYTLLLLDEPTSGISPPMTKKIIAALRHAVSEGMTILLIEHNLRVVLEVADFCTFMTQGRISAIGTPQDVLGNSEFRGSYLGV